MTVFLQALALLPLQILLQNSSSPCELKYSKILRYVATPLGCGNSRSFNDSVIASEARQSIYTAYKYSATINGLNRIIFKNPVTCESEARQSIAQYRLNFQLLIIVA